MSLVTSSPTRPAATIALSFEAAQLGSRLVLGDFTWGVTAGLAVVQDKLSQYEAEQLAHVLNRQANGFREVVGLARRCMEQIPLKFEHEETSRIPTKKDFQRAGNRNRLHEIRERVSA